MTRLAKILLVSVLTLLCSGVLASGAGATASAPVEPYAGYEPQSTCTPVAKPGTVAAGRWIVATYGGRFGNISRPCTGTAVSEHKEGRAFDWTLDARSAADRARALRLLRSLFARGADGQPAELARRMGVMYVIWNDRMFASYRQFRAVPYLSAGCTKVASCSATLRHRNHLHLSLTRAGGLGRTSWYLGRVPAARS